MKKLNKLKINEIAKNNLSHKEMKMVAGGIDVYCSCGCQWEDNGGSSVEDNCKANATVGAFTTHWNLKCIFIGEDGYLYHDGWTY